MKKVAVFCFALIFLSVSAVTVSAGDFARLLVINELLSNSHNYDVVWEGPYKDGKLTVAFNGGQSGSVLDSVGLNNGDYQVLEYNRNNVFSYNNQGRSTPWSFGRSYPSSQSSIFRDQSEQIRVLNTKPNIYSTQANRFNFEQTAIVYGNQNFPRFNPISKTYSWRYQAP